MSSTTLVTGMRSFKRKPPLRFRRAHVDLFADVLAQALAETGLGFG